MGAAAEVGGEIPIAHTMPDIAGQTLHGYRHLSSIHGHKKSPGDCSPGLRVLQSLLLAAAVSRQVLNSQAVSGGGLASPLQTRAVVGVSQAQAELLTVNVGTQARRSQSHSQRTSVAPNQAGYDVGLNVSRQTSLGSVSRERTAVGSVVLRDGSFCFGQQSHRLRHLGANGLVLVSGQSHSSQNTNDRDYDHQFDKGKTLLVFLCHFHVPVIVRQFTHS